MQIEDTIDAVRDWFDEQGYHTDYDAERKILAAGFNLDCKLRSIRIIVSFNDKGYCVHAVSSVNGDPENPDELMRFLTLANYGLLAGNFELDLRDGEVRFKFWVPTDGLDRLPPEIIHSSIDLPCFIFNHFGNGIAALAMGFSDAETEFGKAMGKNGE